MSQAATTASTSAAARPQGRPPVSNELVIKCAGLTKTFRDFWLRNRVQAVRGIDLDVRKGEVFGLLGPNGSGKSTTIKMILGLLHPTSGHIAVFGHHPRDVAIKKNIGYLPEETYLYRFLNARETLEYYGRLFHQNRAQRKQRIDMLLEMVGLDKVARRPIGEYSKGMQRRIGLAQALINDPQLLILDEPTTGLDPIGTRQIKDLIVELAQRGKTILLCSHLLADVEDVCDRVSIMYGGKVRRQGTVDDLLVQEGLTNIETPELTSEEVQAIEQLLEKRGKHITRVQQPRQKLETLFLNIVHEAQAEGADTHGAGSGGAIAEFLTSEAAHLPEGDGEALIDKLVAPEAPPAPATPAAAPAQTPEAVQDVGTQDEVIDQLVAEQKPASEPEPAPAPQQQADADSTQPRKKPTPPPAEEDIDESILDSLMGGDENNGKA